MAVLENIIVPALTFFVFAIVYAAIFGGFLFLMYKIFFTPKKRVWFSYKVMRKKYSEEDVAWCMEAIEKNLTEIDIRKHLLLHNTSMKRTEEICLIFNEVQTQLKGGLNKDGKHKDGESNGKAKLPKVE